MDKPPFNGSAGHSSGSSRAGMKPDTLIDMRTELTAVPHASLSEKPKKPRWVKGKLHQSPKLKILKSRSPKLNDGEVSARQLLQNTELEQLVHYVGFLPSRCVNPASRIDFTDATLASSLVPAQCASLTFC